MIRRPQPGDNVAEFISAIQGGFEDVRADYKMTQQTRHTRRRTGLAPRGGSGDYHIRHESKYYESIENARDMDRNDAIIGQTLDRAVDNEIQDGFTLDIETGDSGIDEYLAARWEAETCNADEFDVAGEMDFHDLERMASRSTKLDGDCGISALPIENKIQFFEAHSIRADHKSDALNENQIVNGVEINELRRRVAYHIALDKLEPYDTTKIPSERVETYDARGIRQFFHVYQPKRTTLTRGVTALHPVFEISGMFEDVNFAKLIQQQLVSFFAIIRNRAVGSPNVPPPSTARGVYGDKETLTTGSVVREIENVAPGMEIIAPEGETLSGFSPDVPNPNYFEQVKLILRMIGANFGMPLMMVLLDGSDSTFHGHRAAMAEARRGFRANQKTLIKKLHRPLYLWKVNQWLIDDYALRRAATRGNVDVFGHTWDGPGFPYIEPKTDAEGDILQLTSGLNSPRRIQRSRNRNFKDIVRETVEDNALAISAAIKKANELNTANPGLQVSWRDVISMPMPAGTTMTQSVQAVEETSNDNGDSQRVASNGSLPEGQRV